MDKAGFYIHFPFCLKKCGYCDFYSVVSQPHLVAGYLRALQQEIQLYASQMKRRQLRFQTLYLGGGTPSISTPEQCERLLHSVINSFQFISQPEITLEINPETVTADKLKSFHQCGINRLSIGVQSFNERELKILDRIHSSHGAVQCVSFAKQVKFENVSIDLIFGIPGQSLADWRRNLQQAIALDVQHISMYGLTSEPGTPLEKKCDTGELKPVSEELEREMYLLGIELLTAAGFNHYEISNFGLPHFYAQHNQLYWTGNPYLGLGPSAHSFWDNRRQWNVADIHAYIDHLDKKLLPVAGLEQLTREQQLFEFIMLGLRTTNGIGFKNFRKQFTADFMQTFGHVLKRFSEKDAKRLFEISEDRLKLTAAGMLLYNEICSYFV